MTAEDSLWMSRKMLKSSTKPTASSEKITSQILEIKAAGLLKIDRKVAVNVLNSMIHTACTDTGLEHPYLQAYLALLKLDQGHHIDFNLQDVVKEVIDRCCVDGAVTSKMACLLERVEQGVCFECPLDGMVTYARAVLAHRLPSCRCCTSGLSFDILDCRDGESGGGRGN